MKTFPTLMLFNLYIINTLKRKKYEQFSQKGSKEGPLNITAKRSFIGYRLPAYPDNVYKFDG